MNEVTNLPEVYEVTYNSKLGRYEFVNSSTTFGFGTLIYTKQTQEVGAANNVDTIPRIQENGNGAWRLLGTMAGPDVAIINNFNGLPGVAPNGANLQFATQLF